MRIAVFGLLTMASVVFAEPAVLMESDNDTVVKIQYLGSALNNAPILSVTGGKWYGAIIEGTWRGSTGRVPGYTLPNPGVAAGLAGAGPIGVTGFGSGYVGNVIGGHFLTNSTFPGGNNYAVEARATGPYKVYGVYAQASGGTYQNWAGYFLGSTYATGTYQGSDRMFKKDVEDLSGSLKKVMAIKPKSYLTRVDEFKNVMELPKGRQIGLIAQDLQEVIPELVMDVESPPQLTPEEMKDGVQKDGLKFKAVNYTGLIPVLIAAMQEQQALIQALQAEVAALKK